MKIVRIEDLHADGGWANLSFLKIKTDEGITGWAECTQFFGAHGLTAVIHNLGQQLIGKDPREIGKIGALLYAQTRIATGGLNSQAAAAIENACLDIKAKALGVPVCELLGGAQRSRLPVYCSHVGMYRLRYADIFEKMGQPILRKFDDLKVLGKEVVARGFRGLKTNIITFDGPTPQLNSPGFGRGPTHPELNIDNRLIDAAVRQMAALREAVGPDIGLHLDLNFNYKPEGYRRLAKALEPFNLTWLEIDTYEPEALARIRQSTSTPIASLEAIYGRRNFRHRPDVERRDRGGEDGGAGGLVRGERGAA
jgi:L-alanine-DL-glutamate epimerase-like enolase superfamily enzyme